MALPTSLQSMYAPLCTPPTQERPLHVVLACTGSVASVKVVPIVQELLQYQHVEVQVLATRDALHFVDTDALHALGDARYTVNQLAASNQAAERQAHGEAAPMPAAPRAHLWTDADEWAAWRTMGDPVLHIELRRWADVVLIAPCSANTLAKIAQGLCDNLVTSFLRALAPTTPTYLFPAMNTLMYMHPFTEKQLRVVREELHYTVHGPITKRLACGDLGIGAMLEWTSIVRLVVEEYKLQR